MFILHNAPSQKKKCISGIRRGEWRRVRRQAAKAPGREWGGDWCFARRVAEQPERESPGEPGAESAPLLHFILASSGAEIDIETEGGVREAGRKRKTGALDWA